MPKAFSAKEKDVIRQQIRDKSKRLFELHGLRKTKCNNMKKLHASRNPMRIG